MEKLIEHEEILLNVLKSSLKMLDKVKFVRSCFVQYLLTNQTHRFLLEILLNALKSSLKMLDKVKSVGPNHQAIVSTIYLPIQKLQQHLQKSVSHVYFKQTHKSTYLVKYIFHLCKIRITCFHPLCLVPNDQFM
jgi:hypothetical protein